MNHTEINSIKHLANYLRCDVTFLEDFLNGSIIVYDSRNWQETEFYNSIENNSSISPVRIKRFYIPKKNRKLGYRIVHKVNTDTLSNILKGLNTNLSQLYKPLPVSTDLLLVEILKQMQRRIYQRNMSYL